VALVAEGRGGLELSHGCIDVSGALPPHLAVQRLPEHHPYRLAGLESLEAALLQFVRLTQDAGIPYVGELGRSLRLPTALGADHPTTLAPASLAAGDLAQSDPATLADLEGFRDFYAQVAISELQGRSLPVSGPVSLPLLLAPTHRDAYSTDIARLFDDAAWRGETARAWKPRTLGVIRLGLPAVLGLERSPDAIADLEKRIGIRLFEIPTLPPSLPGLRLERALRRAAVAAGVWLLEGSHAIGRVDGRSGGRRVAGVVVQAAGGPRVIDAGAVLLATGGMLNGGLVARQDGRVQESVFDLPVVSQRDRAGWTGPSLLTPQPYASFGVSVTRDMRPTGPDGQPIFDNLFAAGGVLAGADRTAEGSRQGIDLATAYRAVEAALA
jgi:glycerol-3-phosphate dehydrogenase subunit B